MKSDRNLRELASAAFEGDRDLSLAYWIRFLWYAKARGRGGTAPIVDEISLAEDVGGDAPRWRAFLAVLPDSGLVDVCEDDWTVREWSRFQQDPTGAERQARHRDRQSEKSSSDEPLRNEHNAVSQLRNGVTTTGRDRTRRDGEVATRRTGRRPRPTDQLYDAFVEKLGREPTTKAERGKWNTGLKDLRDARIGPESVGPLIEAYRARYGGIDCNPRAIASNLGELSAGSKPSKPLPRLGGDH